VRDGALLPLSSATATGRSGGPLAMGTPTTTVGLRKGPPVVGLVRRASGGLSDGGSKANAMARFLFHKTITRGGVLCREKHPTCGGWDP
jgi:hypothetical protein